MGWGNMFSSESNSSYTETNTINSAVGSGTTLGAGSAVVSAAAIKGGVNTVGYSNSTTNVTENITQVQPTTSQSQPADPFTSPVASSIFGGATDSATASPSQKQWFTNAGLWIVVIGVVAVYFFFIKGK